MTATGRTFDFCTTFRLVELTGLRARNLAELLALLEIVPGSSIFYHTHHQYLARHVNKPAFRNDFALWTCRALQEPSLSERLSAVDARRFTSIGQLREALLEIIETHLTAAGATLRDCPAGEELHFCQWRTFLVPTGILVTEPEDFFAMLPAIPDASLYFHFFEARLQLGRPSNDFSAWLQGIGCEELAAAIDRLNPYPLTLRELRGEILKLGREYIGGHDGREPARL